MFITLTNIQSGVPVKLAVPIDNRNQHRHVAVHEVFYTVSWTNINSDNNWLETKGKRFTVQEGYYDICTLEKQLFHPNNISAELNYASLRVTLISSASFTISPSLAKMLGFDGHQFAVPNSQRSTFVGDNPIDMAVNAMLFVHLSELNTSSNCMASPYRATGPSDLLRILPPSRGMYCEAQHNYFTTLQFKELEEGFHETLCITIKNSAQRTVDCNNLYVTLEIK